MDGIIKSSVQHSLSPVRKSSELWVLVVVVDFLVVSSTGSRWPSFERGWQVG